MTRSEMAVLTEAVAKLDSISGSDPEKAHGEADQVLLDVFTAVAPWVTAAYARVMGRTTWWAGA